jgi:hypothetical protein
MDLWMDSHIKQCCYTSSSPLPKKYGYQAIDPPMCPTISIILVPIKINPNAPGCNLPGDPAILPLFTVTSLLELTEFEKIEFA